MTLANKYLRYSPEITLEIFKLVWDKLIESGFKSRYNNKLYSEFDCFKGRHNYFIIDDICFNTHMSLYIINGLETTVQEILGYDPFVKEEFVLPEKWCIKIKANGIPEEVAQWRKSSWSSPGYMLNSGMWDCNNAIGYTEITFEQFKKYVLKESIETPKEVIPEYVECIKPEFWVNTIKENNGNLIFDTKNFKFSYYSRTWEQAIGNANESNFKPSTKEAFDAQNQPKPIEDKRFFVALQNKLISHGGASVTIGRIYKTNLRFEFYDDNGNFICFLSDETNIRWFATKFEAEEFAKTLVEPVKHSNGILDAVDVKTSLKQVVHCKTQEEWDFVTKKLGYKFTTKFELRRNDTINPELHSCESKLFYERRSEYKLLSFQEWCDLNGYKMKKEVKFEVGKWYWFATSSTINSFFRIIKCSAIESDRVRADYWLMDQDAKIGNKAPNAWILNSIYSLKELSIEEIQQYLPDGHPDKIKVDREFKVGDWVYFMGSGKSIVNTLWQPGKILQIKCIIRDSLTFHGCSNYTEGFRHATSEEINQHLISIGQIPAGEPLNTGIEPNKDGMFKYKQTMPGASWSGGTIDNHLDVMIQSKTQSEIEFNYLPEPK